MDYYGSFGPSVGNEYARAVILSKTPQEMHFQETCIFRMGGQTQLGRPFYGPENRFRRSGCVPLPRSNRMNITLS